MATPTRVLLVGWDAADWKIINPLMDRGLMPATQRIVEDGAMAPLATLSPPLSPMLWTSIATGKRPFKHGILGFTEPTPDRSGVQPITNLSRKTKAIWNILNQNGKRCNVVGWWPSHPAEPIDGVMVSNHYQVALGPLADGWPMLPHTVHPERLIETLADLRVHPQELGAEHVLPFIPHGDEIDQAQDTRLAWCVKTISECSSIHACATHLIEHEPWDFMAVYFDAIDHFCHLFMRYHPPRREFVSEQDFRMYQHVISTAYVYHDMMLGRLVELAGKDTVVILMSDHGFHPDHLRPSAIPSEPAGPAAEHRDFGVLAIAGPGIRRDVLVHGASLLDIAPTILTLFGLPVGADMDGRPLFEAFEDRPDVAEIASWDLVAGRDGQHSHDAQLDPVNAREGLEQLIALGYIDRPPDDSTRAVTLTQRELDYNLARAYMDAGQHGEAAPILEGLYRDYPLEFRFGIQLALCFRALEMIDALVMVVDDLNGRWRIGAELARKRLIDIGEIARQRRIERRVTPAGTPTSPTPVDALVDTGEAREGELFNRAELAVISELRAIAGGNERTLDFLGACAALARNDSERALSLLDKAAESNSHLPGYHLQVGETYLSLKRASDAERSFHRALELDPDNPHGHLGQCRVHLLRRKPREALAAATQAIALKYHFPTAHYFLAVARHRLGDDEAAAAAAEQAISQNPNFPEAHLLLARLHRHRFGSPEQADEHRRIAHHIRRATHRHIDRCKLPVLPPIDEIAMENGLPRFPAPDVSAAHFRTPLAAALLRSGQPERQKASGDREFVTVVSGLPRSGTSMMMQMLAAGGLPPLTDGLRAADESNPRGYFELERVKRLAEENDWLLEARGRVLKVVAPLVPFLPQEEDYRVIFMDRDIDEVLSSQTSMLARLGRDGAKLELKMLKQHLLQQVERATSLLEAHGIPVLVVPHRDVLDQPAAVAARLAEFLGRDLDQVAMIAGVDARLHRERASGAGPSRAGR